MDVIGIDNNEDKVFFTAAENNGYEVSTIVRLGKT